MVLKATKLCLQQIKKGPLAMSSMKPMIGILVKMDEKGEKKILQTEQ